MKLPDFFSKKRFSMAQVVGMLAAVLTVTSSVVFAVDLGTPFQSGEVISAAEMNTKLDALNDAIVALEAKTASMTASGDDVFFTGVNVHVRNGAGATDTTNTTGNLILGYNEMSGDVIGRDGSHNLVIGTQSTYQSYGGIVGGVGNDITGAWSMALSGYYNRANGPASVVISGGRELNANGTPCTACRNVIDTASGAVIVSGQNQSISSGADNGVIVAGARIGLGGSNTAGTVVVGGGSIDNQTYAINATKGPNFVYLGGSGSQPVLVRQENPLGGDYTPLFLVGGDNASTFSVNVGTGAANLNGDLAVAGAVAAETLILDNP